MKYIYSFFIFLAVIALCSAQEKRRISTSVLVDIDFKGLIEVWDKPGGRLIKKLKHNFEAEDYLVLDILNKNDSMYFVNANYAISGEIIKGWIKKNNSALGIYSKAYSGNLKLYQCADKTSGVSIVVKEYTPELYHVLDCKNGWLLVEIKLNNRIYKGWMAAEMQCDNPYSTCN